MGFIHMTSVLTTALRGDNGHHCPFLGEETDSGDSSQGHMVKLAY